MKVGLAGQSVFVTNTYIMKKLISILLFLFISAASFGQPTTTTTLQLKADYLKKSKHQKTVATVMLISGPVLIVAPALLVSIKSSKGKVGGDATQGIVYGTIMVGFLCLPVSIPFFINSARYKKKGMSLSFKNESVPQIQKSSFVYKSLPSLTLKISL